MARAVAITAMAVAVGTTVTAAPVTRPRTEASTAAVLTPYRATVVVNGARPGPVFQGIGAISGGGGNSRLLIDYPPRERAHILDYLFLPHFGASLQMLKLEIGGGGFSTDGSEPSVEPAKGQLDCGAGYEFWLARQALARNPAIKLYGLQWTAPAWVRDGHGGLWSRADVGYVVGWLRCARQNGLAISYVGGWNEHFQDTPLQRAWFVTLRAALNTAGFADTRIVAADQTPQMPGRRGHAGYSPLLVWQAVAADMVTDPSFGRVVSVLGVHDTCGLPTTGYRCVVAAPARTLSERTGKPLWESELGATPAIGTNPALPGPGGLARALNDAYNHAGITGILVWPLIDAIPPDLPHENRGLVWADRPWDGYYRVMPLTWVIAQTTQFTAPGWRHAAGANGTLPAGGSYDTYLAPGRSAWSMVAQTSVSTAAQQITVHVTGGLPARVVHVWSTSLRGAGQFIRRGDIIPDRGAFGALLRPGYVYTFTTTTGQSRAGGHPLAVPVAGPMPVRYTATPDGAGLADMLAPIEGSFGYVHGVLTQTAAGEPVEWQYPGRSPAPYAIIGENGWRDYTVSARVILPASGTGSPGAALIARFEGFRGSAVSQFRGYELRIRGNGTWQIVANGPAAATLASGSVAAARAYALSLTTRGSTISAQINGVPVATVTNRMYRFGPAGLGSLGYYPVRYPGFTIGHRPGTGPIDWPGGGDHHRTADHANTDGSVIVDYADAVAAFFVPRDEETPPPAAVTEGGPARRLRDACEPVAMHAVWNRTTNERLAQLGLDFLTSYVGGRGACLGDPAGAVVAAAFAWFEPGLVATLWDAARTAVAPGLLAQARDEATVASLREILAGEDPGEVANLLADAAEAADGMGRPLFSGRRADGRPRDAVHCLWWACSLVREHRGDSHVAAAAAAGLDPVEMNILTELWIGMPLLSYTGTRGWAPEVMQAAVARLESRGWVRDGGLTDEGLGERLGIEQHTDAQEQPIVAALGDRLDEACDRLNHWGQLCIAAGAFPPDILKRAAG